MKILENERSKKIVNEYGDLLLNCICKSLSNYTQHSQLQQNITGILLFLFLLHNYKLTNKTFNKMINTIKSILLISSSSIQMSLLEIIIYLCNSKSDFLLSLIEFDIVDFIINLLTNNNNDVCIISNVFNLLLSFIQIENIIEIPKFKQIMTNSIHLILKTIINLINNINVSNDRSAEEMKITNKKVIYNGLIFINYYVLCMLPWKEDQINKINKINDSIINSIDIDSIDFEMKGICCLIIDNIINTKKDQIIANDFIVKVTSYLEVQYIYIKNNYKYKCTSFIDYYTSYLQLYRSFYYNIINYLNINILSSSHLINLIDLFNSHFKCILDDTIIILYCNLFLFVLNNSTISVQCKYNFTIFLFDNNIFDILYYLLSTFDDLFVLNIIKTLIMSLLINSNQYNSNSNNNSNSNSNSNDKISQTIPNSVHGLLFQLLHFKYNDREEDVEIISYCIILLYNLYYNQHIECLVEINEICRPIENIINQMKLVIKLNKNTICYLIRLYINCTKCSNNNNDKDSVRGSEIMKTTIEHIKLNIYDIDNATITITDKIDILQWLLSQQSLHDYNCNIIFSFCNKIDNNNNNNNRNNYYHIIAITNMQLVLDTIIQLENGDKTIIELIKIIFIYIDYYWSSDCYFKSILCTIITDLDVSIINNSNNGNECNKEMKYNKMKEYCKLIVKLMERKYPKVIILQNKNELEIIMNKYIETIKQLITNDTIDINYELIVNILNCCNIYIYINYINQISLNVNMVNCLVSNCNLMLNKLYNYETVLISVFNILYQLLSYLKLNINNIILNYNSLVKILETESNDNGTNIYKIIVINLMIYLPSIELNYNENMPFQLLLCNNFLKVCLLPITRYQLLIN